MTWPNPIFPAFFFCAQKVNCEYRVAGYYWNNRLFLIGIIWDTLVHLVASAPFCSEMCFPFFDSEILIVFSLEFVADIFMNNLFFSKTLIFDHLKAYDVSKAPTDKFCFTIKQPTCNEILAKNFLLSSFLFFQFFPGDATMVRHAVAYSLFRSAH